jgi:hypothetical protein
MLRQSQPICKVKRGERTMEIVHKLWGDGTVKKEREEAKQNEGSSSPHHGGSTPRVVRLPERLENSNFILVKIPIEMHNLGHGQRLICMDRDRLA